MRRSIVLFLAVLVVASLIAPSVGAQTSGSDPTEPCGLTTLDATVQIGPQDGILECGPGQPLVVRDELAGADPARAQARTALTSFFAIADVQLADEESPARGEGVDPCEPLPGVSSSAFRPHETMVPHLMNAHIRAADAIAATGGPNLGAGFDFLVGLGDLADNQQWNEIRWIIDIIDGGKLIDPDTGDDPILGGEGYDGPQADDPTGAGERTTADVAPNLPDRVLDLANEPFWATGFRLGNDVTAQRLPWYSLPGNHDVKVQGTLPDELTGHHHDDMKAWRAVYRSYYIGHAKVAAQDIPPDYKKELCKAFAERDPQRVGELLARMAADPENAARATARKVIPSDEARMPLYRSQQMKQPGDEEACLAVATPARPLASDICRSSWIDQHRVTDGIPVGHGYGESDEDSARCRDEDGNLLERACYSFDRGLFHYAALDSNPPEGAEAGNIDPAQFEWLERDLQAHSTRYFDADGNEVSNEDATDRLIVIFAHHPTVSMHNQAPTSPGFEGEDLIELLLRFPNVILNVNGHTHENRIWPHSSEELGTAYWEVNTAAIADHPTQSRVIEIADNRDGTLSIFGTVFDAAVAPDVAQLDWRGHDHTSEIELGDAERDINEDWLASWGREVMFHDPQRDLMALGEPKDRNVELLLHAPAWFLSRDTSISYTGPTSAQVGSKVTLSARLVTTDDGGGIGGQTVTFEWSGRTVSGVTDDDGVAEAAMRFAGQPGTAPLTVSFAGSDGYEASSVTVDFTTFPPGKNKPSRVPTSQAVLPAI